MWTCDIIPWVSWWTIAFITGIYDRLIDALYNFNYSTLKLLFQWKIKKIRKKIDGNFLVLLFSGIFVAIISLAQALQRWLAHYPKFIWAFFFGLILASAFLMKKEIKKYSISILILFLLWWIIGFFLSNLEPVDLGAANSTMLFSGAIAIIAMILPWISGSYILLILWQYTALLAYVTSFTKWEISSLIPIWCFMIWAVIGLLLFSKVLHRIKKNYHNQMVAILIGIMLGSLNKLRPRKEAITTTLDRHWQEVVLTTKNLLPTIDTNFFLITLSCVLWISIVLWINFLSSHFFSKK